MAESETSSKRVDAAQSASGPWIRLDRAIIRESSKRGEYAVRIEGHNLLGAIVPPKIMVGNQLLNEMEFTSEGKTIEGIVRQKPNSREVTVDYGFARAETEASWEQ